LRNKIVTDEECISFLSGVKGLKMIHPEAFLHFEKQLEAILSQWEKGPEHCRDTCANVCQKFVDFAAKYIWESALFAAAWGSYKGEAEKVTGNVLCFIAFNKNLEKVNKPLCYISVFSKYNTMNTWTFSQL
jgi:hypothetical protein